MARRHEKRLAGIEDPVERGTLVVEATREPASAEADATPGSYCFVRVIETHNVGVGAPPVPRDLFVGPRDEIYAYDPENGCLELLPPTAITSPVSTIAPHGRSPAARHPKLI